MEAKLKTVCFTGHRKIEKQELNTINTLLPEVLDNLYMSGFRHFIAGGALGFDTIAAEQVITLRKRYHDCTLTIAIPYEGQSKNFSKKDKEKYLSILNSADNTIITSPRYFSGCFHVRNQYMVDNSSVCVAFCREATEKGGSLSTIKYAKRKELEIINLAESQLPLPF